VDEGKHGEILVSIVLPPACCVALPWLGLSESGLVMPVIAIQANDNALESLDGMSDFDWDNL